MDSFLFALLAKLSPEQLSSYGSAIGVVIVAILVQLHAGRAKYLQEMALNEQRESAAKHRMQLLSVHSLVNSALGRVLRQAVFTTQRVADLTQDPKDKAIAEQAVLDFNEYDESQKNVDKSEASFLEGQKAERARSEAAKASAKTAFPDPVPSKEVPALKPADPSPIPPETKSAA